MQSLPRALFFLQTSARVSNSALCGVQHKATRRRLSTTGQFLQVQLLKSRRSWEASASTTAIALARLLALKARRIAAT